MDVLQVLKYDIAEFDEYKIGILIQGWGDGDLFFKYSLHSYILKLDDAPS